jgi:hypothetical protein
MQKRRHLTTQARQSDALRGRALGPVPPSNVLDTNSSGDCTSSETFAITARMRATTSYTHERAVDRRQATGAAIRPPIDRVWGRVDVTHLCFLVRQQIVAESERVEVRHKHARRQTPRTARIRRRKRHVLCRAAANSRESWQGSAPAISITSRAARAERGPEFSSQYNTRCVTAAHTSSRIAACA